MSPDMADTLIIAALCGVGGYLLNQFSRNVNGVTNSRVTDADLQARLNVVEQWQRDNRTIHADLQKLTGVVEQLARSMEHTSREMTGIIDRLSRRMDAWMADPYPLNQRVKSPYDHNMRDWITEDERSRP